jgi:hypothetical protein
MESHGSNNQSDKKQWRAEEAIAGNAEALQALRDLITFPLYYSTQAHILGLKVNSSPPVLCITCYEHLEITNQKIKKRST